MYRKVIIIGSGNVAEAISKNFPKSDKFKLVGLYSRNITRAKEIADSVGCNYFTDIELIPVADIFIIAVSDSAISEISSAINFGDAIVAHTSGSCGIDTLSSAIKHRAVFYPLQTFTSGHKVCFEKIPIFVEANSLQTFTKIKELAELFSKEVYGCDSELRQKLHIAAVFVCNFVNHMYVIGEQLMNKNELEFDLLKPLIEETTQKMLVSNSPKRCQTGPAVREDMEVIKKHLSALEYDQNLKNIYEKLTDNIIADKQERN